MLAIIAKDGVGFCAAPFAADVVSLSYLAVVDAICLAFEPVGDFALPLADEESLRGQKGVAPDVRM
ncbi:hypothetical protein [Pelagicoccus sp. SDUM812005]|uniref:hypothetical protein n=1 Tax=Pelagicoccus sp. SDUM812005 TaxID=3041257 RepID=UPI002811C478|nr:hypothetical protein [Pelagicoccus sp. SDUM812005]